jgi:helicase
VTSSGRVVRYPTALGLDRLHRLVKSTQKEPQTWFGALATQGIPPALVNTLRRYVPEEHTGTLRAKKTAGTLYWISPTPMAEIEAALTRHGGAFDGAAGPVRSVASRTGDLLAAVARVASFIHPGLDLDDRVARLLVRLELGVPAGAVALARHAGAQLTRGEYQELLKAGLCSADAVDAASDESISACIGGNLEKVQVVREAVAGIRAELQPEPESVLPIYEGQFGCEASSRMTASSFRASHGCPTGAVREVDRRAGEGTRRMMHHDFFHQHFSAFS